MKKFLLVLCELSLCAMTACGSDDESDGLNLVEVPATQDNTLGNACDVDTFVEHCDGTKVIYCGWFETTVVANDCATSEYGVGTCAVAENGATNYANCVFKEDICDKENETMQGCGYDVYGYEAFQTAMCIKFNDGKKYWQVVEEKICSNLCKDGCTQEICDEEDVCSADNSYFKSCDAEDEEGNLIFAAYDCQVEEKLTCSIDEDGYGLCK